MCTGAHWKVTLNSICCVYEHNSATFYISVSYVRHMDFLVVFLTGKLGNLFTLPCSEILHLDLHFLKVAQRAVARPTTCHQLNSSFRELPHAPPDKQTKYPSTLFVIALGLCYVFCNHICTNIVRFSGFAKHKKINTILSSFGPKCSLDT